MKSICWYRGIMNADLKDTCHIWLVKILEIKAKAEAKHVFEY